MLTATESFKFLIQAAMHLESEGYRPQDGNEDEQADYDAKIGYLIAVWVDETRPDQNAVWFLGNILFVHCGYDATRRFCDDVELLGYDIPYNFCPGSTNLVRDGHRGLNVLGTMDIYDLAANGRKQGWKRMWCPFRHSAEILWYAGWDGDDRDHPECLEANRALAARMVDLTKAADR